MTINNLPVSETDRAIARQIDLRSKIVFLVGILAFAVITVCVGIILIDSHNAYETMVLDEEIKINGCVKEYDENRCHPYQRVPALQQFCQDLELCMSSDPRKVAKRSVAFSSLIADNANRLFAGLKLQTILVISLLVFGSIISCNLLFCITGPRLTKRQEYANSLSKKDN